MLEKHLQELGLNDKEASVYVALLAVDYDSVIEIAKKTKIQRTAVYAVIKSLEQKGLVSETQVGKKTYYQAEPPERLETFVERQKLSFEERAKRVGDIVSELKAIDREAGQKPVVRFYEGKEGVISASNDFYSLESSDTTSYLIYPRDVVDTFFTEAERDRMKNDRIQKGIRNKVVYTRKHGDLPVSDTSDRIRINEEKYPIACDITSQADHVNIIVYGVNPSAISIESKEVAETIKSIVKYIFDLEKRVKDRE